MREMNSVHLSGNVGSFKFGVTRSKEEEVCTFTVASEKPDGIVTWVRVNVYGGNVSACRRFLRQGMRIVVEGELMNRYSPAKDDKVLEVRCLEVYFVDREIHDGKKAAV